MRLYFVIFLIIVSNVVIGQYQLDVENDARIGGRLSIGNSSDKNTVIGTDAGISISSGIGIDNVFLGYKAGFLNALGNQNTFLGSESGALNTASGNTFVGYRTGFNNTSGNENVLLGAYSGFLNSTGKKNVFVGFEAGKNSTTGSENTFVGYQSGLNNIDGMRNTFLGWWSGVNNTTGDFNTFVGRNSGRFNTSAKYGTFVGSEAGLSNTSAYFNTCIGYTAGQNTTTGERNTFVGSSAGQGNSTGERNTFVGVQAGEQVTTGSYNTSIGNQSGSNVVDIQNSTSIGYSARATVSNQVVLGNSNVTQIGGAVNWSILSDKAYKKNIKRDKNALAFIIALNPVTYNYDKLKQFQEEKASIEQFQTSRRSSIHEEQTEISEMDFSYLEKTAKEQDKIQYNGFIAQEVEEAMEKAQYEFSGLVKPESESENYALRYAEFVVPLVGAVQEQQKMIEEKEERIEHLEKELAEIRTVIRKLLTKNNEGSLQTNVIHGARLGQNIPNPFEGITKIPYFIPENSRNAHIKIFNAVGQLIDDISIQNFGEGEVQLRVNGLSSGQYYYSLEVDGTTIKSYQMKIVR